MDFNRFLAGKSNLIIESPLSNVIRKIASLKSKGVRVISLAAGDPDPNLIPRDILADLASSILREYPSSVLYSPTAGLPEFKSELVKFLRKYDGVNVDPENIIVTIGGTGAIDLLGRVLLDYGDAVIIENPSYVNTVLAFRQLGGALYGVKLNVDGVDINDLDSKIKYLLDKGLKIKFIYVIPTGHNPTGVTLNIDKRKALLEIASKYDLLIIEDAAYNYLVYDASQIKTLKSMDKENRVIIVGTLSKVLGTGFRVGWIITSDILLRKIVNMKQPIDFCAPTISQYIAYEYLRKGYYEKYHLKAVSKYREKRDVLIKSLGDLLPDLDYIKPIAGMFTMAFLPNGIDGMEFSEKLLSKYHVAIVPGKPFYIDESGHNTIRLNFSRPSMEDIAEGVEKLAKLLKEYA